MGTRSTATTRDEPEPAPDPSPAQLAARAVRHLTVSQIRPATVQPMRLGTTRPSSPRGVVNPGILDYMVSAAAELRAHVREVIPQEEQAAAPRDRDAFYAWLAEQTQSLEPARRRVMEAVLYRQYLEAMLRARDTSVIRPHRCPTCRCFSLVWRWEIRAAACIHPRCVDERGMPSRWTLAQLAERYVENSTVGAATGAGS